MADENTQAELERMIQNRGAEIVLDCLASALAVSGEFRLSKAIESLIGEST